MFISKMNRMFHKHGRVAFGLLTLVIIVPFILYFSAAPSDLLNMFDLRHEKSHVTMYGKTLSQEVIDDNIIETLINLALNGQQVNFESMRDNKEILTKALERYRLLKSAKEKGIKVDDIQLASYIKQIPIFQVKNQFNINMYRMFVTYYLGRFGIKEKMLEETVRENLIINILRTLISQAAVASDDGAKQYYINLNKMYSVKETEFKAGKYINDAKVTDKKLDEYFQKHRNKYLIPAKYKFSLVRFNFINYKDQAEKFITDKMVEAYYNTNKDQFKNKTKTEAESDIRKQLVKAHKEKLAKTDAQKFAVKAFGNIEKALTAATGNEKIKTADIFEKLAEKNNYNVRKTSDWVTKDTKAVPRIGKISEVISILPKLYIDQPISNAVQGKNAYFVVCLTALESPKKADLEQVKDKVASDYKKDEAIKIARENADKAYKEIKALISKGKSIADSDYAFSAIPEFSQKNYMPLLKVKNGVQVYDLVMKTKRGQVSTPLDTEDGALLVYLDNIKTPSEKDYKKADVMKEYKQFKGWLLWHNYKQMLETNSNTIIENKK